MRIHFSFSTLSQFFINNFKTMLYQSRVVIDIDPPKQSQQRQLVDSSIIQNLQSSNAQIVKFSIPEIQAKTNTDSWDNELSMTADQTESTSQSSSFYHQITCQICNTELNVRWFHKIFYCQHKYCITCLESYLKHQVNSFSIPYCPNESCFEVLLNEDCQFFYNLPSKFISQYERVKNFNTVSRSENLKYCPKQECSGIVKLMDQEENQKVVQTSQVVLQNFIYKKGKCQKCKQTFCWNCMMKYHINDCEDNKVDYLEENFHYRQCSSCKIIVQRNKGCPHITCVCKYEFCYYCGLKWSEQHLEKCLKKSEDEEQDNQDEVFTLQMWFWIRNQGNSFSGFDAQDTIGGFRHRLVNVDMNDRILPGARADQLRRRMQLQNRLEGRRTIDNSINFETNQVINVQLSEIKLTAETFLPYRLTDFLLELINIQTIQKIPVALRCPLFALLLLIFYLPSLLLALWIDIFLMTIGFAILWGKKTKHLFVVFLMLVFLPITFLFGLAIGLTRKKRYIAFRKAFNQGIQCKNLKDESKNNQY